MCVIPTLKVVKLLHIHFGAQKMMGSVDLVSDGVGMANKRTALVDIHKAQARHQAAFTSCQNVYKPSVCLRGVEDARSRPPYLHCMVLVNILKWMSWDLVYFIDLSLLEHSFYFISMKHIEREIYIHMF
jgi:hypothetical protein